jgi:hypothetical protein
MTPAEVQKRHRDKLRGEGKKIIQVTITDRAHVEALRKFRDKLDLASDTAAANYVLNAALKRHIESDEDQK